MDVLKMTFGGRLMKTFLSKIIGKLLYKKLGYRININILDLDLNIVDGDVDLRVNASASMGKNDFLKFMQFVSEDDKE